MKLLVIIALVICCISCKAQIEFETVIGIYDRPLDIKLTSNRIVQFVAHMPIYFDCVFYIDTNQVYQINQTTICQINNTNADISGWKCDQYNYKIQLFVDKPINSTNDFYTVDYYYESQDCDGWINFGIFMASTMTFLSFILTVIFLCICIYVLYKNLFFNRRVIEFDNDCASHLVSDD